VTTPTPETLAARLTLSRVISDDFRKLGDNRELPGTEGWEAWSIRLHLALATLILAIDSVTSTSGQTGMAMLAPADVGLVLGALDDAAQWREARGDFLQSARYLAVYRQLGAEG
jgi:hypothetical protein